MAEENPFSKYYLSGNPLMDDLSQSPLLSTPAPTTTDLFKDTYGLGEVDLNKIASTPFQGGALAAQNQAQKQESQAKTLQGALDSAISIFREPTKEPQFNPEKFTQERGVGGRTPETHATSKS